MNQTLAIFYEAYRGLRARKMFWVVLFLTLFAAIVFASVGINENGFTLLFWDTNWGPTSSELAPATLYKNLFVEIGIDWWLTRLATALALISTAGIFPNFIAKGAIDLVVARPISRLRLFLTQYAAGMLFVTLQIILFCVAAFLVLGMRGDTWEPGLFLAVPLVVVFFSYLFCVCVFLGVWTRSTLAALLLTLLFWAGLFSLDLAETGLFMFKTGAELERKSLLVERQEVTWSDEGTERQLHTQPADPVAAQEMAILIKTLDTAHRVAYSIKTILPKTSETVDLLERVLTSAAHLPDEQEDNEDPNGPQVFARRLHEEFTNRSPWWIVGTSLGFEALILALAARMFCRRDF